MNQRRLAGLLAVPVLLMVGIMVLVHPPWDSSSSHAWAEHDSFYTMGAASTTSRTSRSSSATASSQARGSKLESGRKGMMSASGGGAGHQEQDWGETHNFQGAGAKYKSGTGQGGAKYAGDASHHYTGYTGEGSSSKSGSAKSGTKYWAKSGVGKYSSSGSSRKASAGGSQEYGGWHSGGGGWGEGGAAGGDWDDDWGSGWGSEGMPYRGSGGSGSLGYGSEGYGSGGRKAAGAKRSGKWWDWRSWWGGKKSDNRYGEYGARYSFYDDDDPYFRTYRPQPWWRRIWPWGRRSRYYGR